MRTQLRLGPTADRTSCNPSCIHHPQTQLISSLRQPARPLQLSTGSLTRFKSLQHSTGSLTHRRSAPGRSVCRMGAKPDPSKETEVTFQNAAGETLSGTLLDGGTQDVCILQHGLSSSRRGCFLPEMAAAMAAAQPPLSSFRFDFSGNGASEGTFRFGNYKAEMEDVRAAALKLRSMGLRVAGLLGHSKAGTVVMLYTAKYADIPRVVDVSGRFAQETGLEERFGPGIVERLEQGDLHLKAEPGSVWKKDFTLTKQDLQERIDTNMTEACAKITPRTAFLIVHGDQDQSVPVSNAGQYHKAVPGSQLEIVQDADHNFRHAQHRQLLIDKVIEFMQRKVDQSVL